MSASDDDALSDMLSGLLTRAREFGARREDMFQQAMEILKDLFGQGDDDES